VLTLTTRGRKLFSQVAPDSASLYEDIEEKFGSDRLDLLYELLEEFHQTLHD
jgi:DNA-binding MarR family transcriptional regulator